MQCLLDTVIFNRLIDGKFIFTNQFDNASFFATTVQIRELRETPDIERRNLLISKFNETHPKVEPTLTGIWNYTGWGEGGWGESELYQKIKKGLDAKKKKRSNTQDALIAEVAITNGYTLVTTDKNLLEVYQQYSNNFIEID